MCRNSRPLTLTTCDRGRDWAPLTIRAQGEALQPASKANELILCRGPDSCITVTFSTRRDRNRRRRMREAVARREHARLRGFPKGTSMNFSLTQDRRTAFQRSGGPKVTTAAFISAAGAVGDVVTRQKQAKPDRAGTGDPAKPRRPADAEFFGIVLDLAPLCPNLPVRI